MPFKQDILSFNSATIHLLSFSSFDPYDYIDQLTDLEKERLLSFKSIKRRMEFTATRILRQRVFGFTHIHYTDIGAPYIPNEGFISISHANGVVSIALSSKEEIAIDLELVSSKAQRLHQKFLNDRERATFNCNSSLEMTKLWSAKEVLYKLASRKGIDFKEHLQIYPHTNGYLGEIQFADMIKQHTIISEQRNELIISLNEIV
jgi:phosphopantetheinyl transferase